MTTYMSNSYHKMRSIHLTEQYYLEALEHVASYNSRLCLERRQRLPFLDSQTGVAQNHSNLFIPYRYRCPGRRHGQIYSYPAQRWKKKCNLPLPDIPIPRVKTADTELIEQDMHPINTIENPVASVDSDSKDVEDSMGGATACTGTSGSVYHDEYYNDWDNLSEPPDAGEIDHRNSDSSDFEETYIKRKSKRKEKKKTGAVGGGGNSSAGGRGGRKKEKEAELSFDRDKPYACDLCGAKYKTRPGLNYHMSHSHNKPPPPDEDSADAVPSPKVVPVSAHDATAASLKRSVAAAAVSAAAKVSTTPTTTTGNGSSSSSAKYCDFCLGDELENKKTGSREEMVSCADCGRCGHPSCLQFTPNMIISVKKYPWQCIECKSCGICGTSDNDDQLLFCDDCDRGYHMYCLTPQLTEPPEGSWSCHLCIEEFYGGQKPESVAEPNGNDMTSVDTSTNAPVTAITSASAMDTA